MRDDGIAFAVEKNPELKRTPEIVEEALSAARELVDGKPSLVVWDVRALRHFDPAGWRALLETIDDLVIAMAIVVNEESRHILGVFDSVLHSFYFPVRLFTDEEEAVSWLKERNTGELGQTH